MHHKTGETIMKSLSHISKLISFIVLLGLVTSTAIAQKSSPKKIMFPKVEKQGKLSLEETLWQRKSTRAFSDKALTTKQIGQLLWAAQGVNRPANQHRTAPSAGGTYPLEIYYIVSEGVYHYLPDQHAAVLVRSGNVWKDLPKEGLTTESAYNAPCVFVITAVIERTYSKYKEPAEHYVYLEGGHAAQNLLLQLIPLGLGGVPNGSILTPKANDILGIPKEEQPIYILTVGTPKSK
jgi:SagB-type dehydrogenase family enzyme